MTIAWAVCHINFRVFEGLVKCDFKYDFIAIGNSSLAIAMKIHPKSVVIKTQVKFLWFILVNALRSNQIIQFLLKALLYVIYISF